MITVKQVAHSPGNCGALIGKRLSGIKCLQNRSYICSRNGKYDIHYKETIMLPII